MTPVCARCAEFLKGFDPQQVDVSHNCEDPEQVWCDCPFKESHVG